MLRTVHAVNLLGAQGESMDYAKRIGQVGALAVVLGVGAAVTTHAIGSAAPTDPSSSSTDSPVDACSPLGGSASSLAAIPGASVPQVGVRQVDPGSIPDDLLNALIDFLAAVRNGLVPIIENRTPVANPQQVSVPEGGAPSARSGLTPATPMATG
ncbi:hypothetical protein XM54_01815 [Mycobacterium tuberculosis]|nr:hypothetical protein XM54_01815 [Mycobacterium tuberculosis]KLL09117.1 hypothetical protein ABI38_02080 [Mycobacterium tuberculosis]